MFSLVIPNSHMSALHMIVWYELSSTQLMCLCPTRFRYEDWMYMSTFETKSSKLMIPFRVNTKALSNGTLQLFTLAFP